MTRLQDGRTQFARDRHAYALAASAALGSIFYGWDIGLIGGILSMASFQKYFGLDKQSQKERDNLSGNIVSVLQAGCFFGALSTGYVAERFGRKPSLIAAGIIYIAGSLIQTVVGLHMSQSTGLSLLYFARFFGGWGVGMVSALVPAYVSECAPPAIRGRCTGMIQVANNIGIMLAFWVNYGSSKNLREGELQWRMPFAVQMVPGVLFVLAMLFQPESPRWLVAHGDNTRAAHALGRVTGVPSDDPSVQATITMMEEDAARRLQASLWKQFRMLGESRPTAYAAFVASLAMFFQQWTGTNAINYYSPTIFASLGVTGQNSGLFATGIYGVVKVVSVGTTVALAVERLGRKRCLIAGALIQAISMFWIAGYVALHRGSHVGGTGYVSILFVYVYAVGYCVGWGPVAWIVAGEVAPSQARGVTLSIALGVNWAFSFLISRITPNMLSTLGYGAFLLFGIMCVIMAVWAYAGLPETAGVALEDVRLLFEHQVFVRALRDAPGGRIFLGGRRAPGVAELKRAHVRDEVEESQEGKKTEEPSGPVEQVAFAA